MNEQDPLIAAAGASGAGFRKLRDLSDPMVLEILNYWYRKRADRLMPCPQDMDPVDFARHMPNLMMIQVDHAPFKLTYRLIGEEVAASHGANYRGRSVLDVDKERPNLGSVLQEVYKIVALRRRPIGAGGNMEFLGRGHLAFEAAYMPLSFTGERTDRIFTVTAYREISASERLATEIAAI